MSIFDDFPNPNDWFVGEKALKWKELHREEIEKAITIKKHTDKLIPPPKDLSECDLPKDCLKWVIWFQFWFEELKRMR